MAIFQIFRPGTQGRVEPEPAEGTPPQDPGDGKASALLDPDAAFAFC